MFPVEDFVGVCLNFDNWFGPSVRTGVLPMGIICFPVILNLRQISVGSDHVLSWPRVHK